jgi:hypothetical protein
MHYSDNSHRWIAQGDVEQSAWEARVRAHLEEHRATMGGPAEVDEPLERRLPRIPLQRQPEPSAKMTVTSRMRAEACRR